MRADRERTISRSSLPETRSCGRSGRPLREPRRTRPSKRYSKEGMTMLNESKVVGMPTSRIDGPLKTTGRAPYAAEHYEPGMLFGYILPATIATGHIIAIDTSEAERFPGVIKVYTHENRP